MVEIRMRSNEKLQESGSMHWKRLTLGEWLMFGWLWFASLYATGLFVTPGMEQTITLILLPLLGESAVPVGSVLWFLLLLGFLGFVIGLPGAILHNSIKYNPDTETPQTESTISDSTCPACESPIDDDLNFCPECGHELRPDTQNQTKKHRGDINSENLTKAVTKVNENDQPPKTDRGTWNPRYPILSVFAAVMLIWGGFFSLGQSGSPTFDFTLFTSLGVLIIPRVRRIVVKTIREKTQRDLTGRISGIVIGGVYLLLVAAVALLMIGETVNDPEATAGVGVMMIVLAFIIAVVIVYAIRGYRRVSKQ